MSKIKLSKEQAVQIAQRYAAYNFLKMQDIAKEFTISKEMVSRAIYYCIFHSLISKTEENFIRDKISDNMSRHAGTKTTSPKFERTLEDRKEFTDNLKFLNQQKCMLAQIKRVKAKIHSLETERLFVKDLDISSFIASEDEQDYIPPRNIEEIEEELSKIKEAFMHLEEEHIVNDKIESIKIKINELEKKYQL